ncbi:hypothetical protein ASG32_03015 [Methylobacterium sp. Leaf361]|uniref:hypothetical protein n=1 Tax=Methylobacterium sp. Leaf361 TaxID=1736352 RepID=UPI0006F2DC69|nr:hypothetical protein [Methylobacterium sp. Leaf361]KQS81736.1 hypothetical protein ASG32_03015 [Methylobacterium sp. Leaf361]
MPNLIAADRTPSFTTALAPLDDESRPLTDSALPSSMIWAGGEAYDELRRRCALPAEDPDALDLDSCALAVGIYRAMMKALVEDVPRVFLTPSDAPSTTGADR